MILPPILDFILHVDRYLQGILQEYGALTYLLLFLIVFCETGLVVAPFLPGDSLLFAAGAFAAIGAFNPFILILLLTIAAILGDSLNYRIGRYIGPRVLHHNVRFINRHYVDHAQKYFEKYGAKTIVIARFVPIVRTFAPFVAGVANMNYPTFLLYNIIGGVVWVAAFVASGYAFGNIQFVKENFGLVTIVIIILSFVPVVYEYIKHKRATKTVIV